MTAVFTPAAGGSLAVFGDAQDNVITISRDAAGALLVNGGGCDPRRRHADRRERVAENNGGNGAETYTVTANGTRVRFARDVGSIVMDLNGVEGIDLNALGGADLVTVNDLTGTGLTQLNVNLGADGAADAVVVNGTGGDDAVAVAGDAGGVTVTGLAAQVNITGADPAQDSLTVNALAGDDVVDASGLAAGAILFTANGGDGDDVLTAAPATTS